MTNLSKSDSIKNMKKESKDKAKTSFSELDLQEKIAQVEKDYQTALTQINQLLNVKAELAGMHKLLTAMIEEPNS